MTAAAAIAALCLKRWKWLPLGALLLGVFAAYSPFAREETGTLALAMTNLACLAALTAFAPAVIGATQSGSQPDFLFIRPVSWWSIWAGRATAYVVVGALCIAGVAVPAYLHDGILSPWLSRPPLPHAAPPLLVLGGLAAVGNASLRAHRPLALACLGCAVLSGIAALYLVAGATAHGLVRVDSAAVMVLFAFLAAPVVVFSWVYLAVGRGEPVRAAVAASVAACVACLPAIIAALAINAGWL